MKNISILQIVLIVMLVITAGLVIAAAATGSTEVVGYNLIWAYVLVAGALASAVFCAVYGMVKSSDGVMSSLISVGVAAVVIGIAYGVANSNMGEIKIVDLQNGEFFPDVDTMITEASVIVIYITMGAAILAAIAGETFNAIEGLKSNDKKAVEEEA